MKITIVKSQNDVAKDRIRFLEKQLKEQKRQNGNLVDERNELERVIERKNATIEVTHELLADVKKDRARISRKRDDLKEKVFQLERSKLELRKTILNLAPIPKCNNCDCIREISSWNWERGRHNIPCPTCNQRKDN
jgi:chromosome segregation ATPase